MLRGEAAMAEVRAASRSRLVAPRLANLRQHQPGLRQLRVHLGCGAEGGFRLVPLAPAQRQAADAPCGLPACRHWPCANRDTPCRRRAVFRVIRRRQRGNAGPGNLDRRRLPARCATGSESSGISSAHPLHHGNVAQRTGGGCAHQRIGVLQQLRRIGFGEGGFRPQPRAAPWPGRWLASRGRGRRR